MEAAWVIRESRTVAAIQEGDVGRKPQRREINECCIAERKVRTSQCEPLSQHSRRAATHP